MIVGDTQQSQCEDDIDPRCTCSQEVRLSCTCLNDSITKAKELYKQSEHKKPVAPTKPVTPTTHAKTVLEEPQSVVNINKPDTSPNLGKSIPHLTQNHNKTLVTKPLYPIGTINTHKIKVPVRMLPT